MKHVSCRLRAGSDFTGVCAHRPTILPARASLPVKKTDALAYLPQLSFSVTARLNTGRPATESTRSATK